MKNKSIFKSMALALMVAGAFINSACTDYKEDLNFVNNRVDYLEQRITYLEGVQNTVNNNLTSLTQIVNNIESGGYLVNITEIENGYTLTFNNGKSVTIYHGKDGKDGANGKDGVDGKDGADGKDGVNGQDAVIPEIGVKKDTDGNWYWTLNGEWLKDADGNKIRANGIDGKDGSDGGADGKDGKDGVDGKDGKDGKDGVDGKDGKDGNNGKDGKDGTNGKDGVTPQLRINATTNEWEVSYDNGKTWKSLGVKATGEKGEKGDPGTTTVTGDSFFKSITVGTDAVTFELSNGTTLELPLYDSFKKVRDRLQSMVYMPDYFDGQIGVTNGTAQTLNYFVKPASVATYLAANLSSMKFVGEDVTITRSTSASITINSATHDGNGLLSLNVTPSGFAAQAGYAFALDIEADGSSYRTTYTPAFLIVLPEKIAIGVYGLYPGMGVVTAGQYLQLFTVFFPDYATSRGITWSSSDTTRGTVNLSGIVAVADNAPDGDFTVTATTTNGKTATLNLTIVDKKIQIDTDQLKQAMAQ